MFLSFEKHAPSVRLIWLHALPKFSVLPPIRLSITIVVLKQYLIPVYQKSTGPVAGSKLATLRLRM